MKSEPAGRAEAICYRVLPGHDEGWDVVIEREHRVVSSTHCSDWHRVERICAELDRLLYDDETLFTEH